MTRICRRTGAVRRFLGLRVVPPLHLSAAAPPVPRPPPPPAPAPQEPAR